MNAFDIIVLLVVGAAAVGGFMRGFVQEILSLAGWLLAVFAVRFLHIDLSAFLLNLTGAPIASALLGFVLLLLVPYAVMRLIAARAGAASRPSLLGPIDRVLGFGFGAVKGTIIAVFAFSIIALGFDARWGVAGRPEWMSVARTYPFINASSQEMVRLISERRAVLMDEGEGGPA